MLHSTPWREKLCSIGRSLSLPLVKCFQQQGIERHSNCAECIYPVAIRKEQKVDDMLHNRVYINNVCHAYAPYIQAKRVVSIH